MARSGQSKTLFLLALASGALMLSGAIVGILALRGETSVFGTSGWTVPLLAGVLAALVALLLVEQPSVGGVDSASKGTTCAACGSSIIEEWRLCPHCGQLLECDISSPIEGGPSRG